MLQVGVKNKIRSRDWFCREPSEAKNTLPRRGDLRDSLLSLIESLESAELPPDALFNGFASKTCVSRSNLLRAKQGSGEDGIRTHDTALDRITV